MTVTYFEYLQLASLYTECTLLRTSHVQVEAPVPSAVFFSRIARHICRKPGAVTPTPYVFQTGTIGPHSRNIINGNEPTLFFGFTICYIRDNVQNPSLEIISRTIAVLHCPVQVRLCVVSYSKGMYKKKPHTL